jgi:hypothetical protein
MAIYHKVEGSFFYIFWDLTPLSLAKAISMKQAASNIAWCLLHAGLLLGLLVNTEDRGVCPSEMSVDFQQATLCYISQDRTLHLYPLF